VSRQRECADASRLWLRRGAIGLSAFDLREVSGAQAYSAPRRNTMPAIPKGPGAYNDYDDARAEYR